MKYYYNPTTKNVLIDENDYTPYLADRGYVEVTKEVFDEKSEELSRLFREKHPEEFEDEIEEE